MTTVPAPCLTGLYAGEARYLMPAGVRSAIVKTPRERVQVTLDGIVGDQQADRRWHGGAGKALHQFAQASYAKIVQRFPELRGVALPGSLGENLSCPALDETNVCIGDRWRFGTVEAVVCQPRNPCRKIDSRYDLPGVATFIARQRITGWYLRVVSVGEAAVGDAMTLVDRPNPGCTIARLLAADDNRATPEAELEILRDCVGLDADWRRRLNERIGFLRQGKLL